jgi:hypothetical protein
MAKYVTMGAGGTYGSSFEAETDEEATALAETAGYEVLDVAVLGDENELILVVA